MNTEMEIESLKQEVARLRREMDEYRQFLSCQPAYVDDDGRQCSAYLTIRCATFELAHPANPGKSQVNIMSGPNGAFVSVMGTDDRTRVIMNVDKDVPELSLFGSDRQCKACLRLDKGEPSFELYGKEGKIGVQLKVLGEEGRGQVGVCEAGKSRAVMKAVEHGGVVSAVHDDGHARISMISRENNGERRLPTASHGAHRAPLQYFVTRLSQ